jgi:hypothetical protein
VRADEAPPGIVAVTFGKTITVTLPQELYVTLEEEAAQTGKSVNDIVVKLVKFRHEAINGKYG